MKKILILFVFALVSGQAMAKDAYKTIDPNRGERSPASTESVSSIDSRDRTFGAGLMLGEPTGLSAKYWLSERGALDFGVAWSFGNETALHMHADYLFHEFDLVKVDDEPLIFYWGGGVRLKFENQTKFGIRIPVGLAYELKRDPLEFFLELAPIVNLAPKTSASINAAVGARYYF